MIIGISSNRKGGGKDTVAKMICYLMADGESSFEYYQIAERYLDFTNPIYTPRIFKFADNLKKGCAILFNEDEELWKTDKDTVVFGNKTRRDVLIEIAKYCRDLDEDVFARTILKEEGVIVSDFRYPNEGEYLQQKKALLIRVERPDGCYVSDMQKIKPERSLPDTFLDNFAFDEIIMNTGNLEMLYDKVRGILVKHKLIEQ